MNLEAHSKLSEGSITFLNKIARLLWRLVYVLLYKPSPSVLHGWRRFLLRCFGARIGSGAHPYPTANIWAPWNLEMGDDTCLSHHVDCYNVAKITLSKGAIVSQYSFLCTATHDYTKNHFPLLVASISIGANAWVTADVFIGPGVNIGEGAVINARSSVFSDIEPWVVAKGNPAKPYKARVQENAL
jgi:putative colanic acid biosynthesis acetyltransferase WcaF